MALKIGSPAADASHDPLAAQSSDLAIVDFLLKGGRHLGINRYNPGPNALSPIDLARAHRHSSVADSLSESEASQPAGSRR